MSFLLDAPSGTIHHRDSDGRYCRARSIGSFRAGHIENEKSRILVHRIVRYNRRDKSQKYLTPNEKYFLSLVKTRDYYVSTNRATNRLQRALVTGVATHLSRFFANFTRWKMRQRLKILYVYLYVILWNFRMVTKNTCIELCMCEILLKNCVRFNVWVSSNMFVSDSFECPNVVV